MAAPAAKPAGETSARLANKPGFIGLNLLDNRNVESVWSVSGDWTDSAPAGFSNRDDATKPLRLIRDRFGHAGSSPTSITGLTEVFILFDLVAGVGDAFSLDSWGFIPLNFAAVDSAGGNVTVQLQISPGDMADFSDVVTVGVFSDTDTAALFATFNVLTATPGAFDQVWTNVRYARLRIVPDTSFSSVVPLMGEVILGKQRILAHAPLRPHDNNTIGLDKRDLVSKSGPRSRYIRNSGRTIMPINFSMASNTTNFGIDEVTTIWDWWEDIGHGSEHFVYMARPVHSPLPLAYYMAVEGDQLEVPMVGPVERQTDYTLLEQTPFRANSDLARPPTF